MELKTIFNFGRIFKIQLKMKKIYSKIISTGSYIPPKIVKNEDFLNNEFYIDYGKKLEKDNKEVIEKFYQITGIKERRYASDEQVNSDLALIAAKNALESGNIDPESLDYIIVGHNFGDTKAGDRHPDFMPAIAARIKHKLGIKNPWCVAYDISFGCPGWLQAMIQADYYIKSGDAKRVLVIGSDTLSRYSDPHDRDGMIYADGAGATILEGVESEEPTGIIKHLSRTDSLEEVNYLYSGQSFNPDFEEDNMFIKMYGHKVYEYAIKHVPPFMKKIIDEAGISIHDIKKVLIHQANEKMDLSIVLRVLRLYGLREIPENFVPMTIGWLGNSSVATIPTLLDLIYKGKLEGHKFNEGDYAIFASVGAGMNINSIIYKF